MSKQAQHCDGVSESSSATHMRRKESDKKPNLPANQQSADRHV